MIHPHLAYIGPGAGFAFLGSFVTLALSALATVASLLLWPFRMIRMAIRRRRGVGTARVRKLIFLGLDGLDPELAEKVDGRREVAEPGAIEGARIVSQVADDVSGAVARGVVNVRDWGEPGEAQHLRFSEPRSEVLCA